MSKNILIVERDVSLMGTIRDALASRGFDVEETTDGKGAPEKIRSTRPDCVVLAVDLDAGQNGYLICKKLKSDDELKGVPVIIIGDPKGFANHQKLKTRAEDYIGKPFDSGAVVEKVGGLVGYPPAPAADDDGFDPSSLLDDEGTGTAVEELAIDTSEETVGQEDADLDMVDAMFDDGGVADLAVVEEEEEIAINTSLVDDEFDAPAERTVVGFMPQASAPSEARTSVVSSFKPQASGPDPRVAELETKLRDLEGTLDEVRIELETERASASSKGGDKEVFALKDSLNKKDREILKLKNELNEKQQEILELRDKENHLAQQVAEESGEMARRDAQLKTVQAKVDQLTAERKKLDGQLNSAREEAHEASARAEAMSTELDEAKERAAEAQAEAEAQRSQFADADGARQTAESDLSEARGELEAVKSQLDEQTTELDELKSQHDQAQMDLDSARTQLTSQATSFAEEMGGLRNRLGELERAAESAEEKARKAQSRLRGQQDQLEQTKSTLQTLIDGLDSPADDDMEELSLDDLTD